MGVFGSTNNNSEQSNTQKVFGSQPNIVSNFSPIQPATTLGMTSNTFNLAPTTQQLLERIIKLEKKDEERQA